jgi:hypothetical protein
MEHFSEQAWADFTRGLSAPAQTQGIHAHLAAGCLNCKSGQSLWGRMRKMALAESMYAPPENLVRLAKLEFAAKQEAQPEKWSVASLLFDSLSQPLPVGVRSAAVAARQVVYEAEDLTVDLRFDRSAQSHAFSAVGQILDRKMPKESLTGTSIVLWTPDGQLVATAETNEFGEFQLEFEPHDQLRLTARVGSRKLQIPLTNLK